jgi:hypothetical protein
MLLQRSDVRDYPLVKLYLTYVDADGRPITGRTKEQFTLVFDSNDIGPAVDAKPIEQTGEPIYLVFVVDLRLRTAGARGISQVAKAALATRGSHIQIVIADSNDLHLLDGVRSAIDRLNALDVPDDARKLIVVVSDGSDAGASEKRAFTDLGKRAMLANIVIDTVGYGPRDAPSLKNLRELARQTNGVERTAQDAEQLVARFADVADEIRKQYVLLFQSPVHPDGREHAFQVLDESGGRFVYSSARTAIPSHVCDCYARWRRAHRRRVLSGYLALYTPLLATILFLAFRHRRRRPI